jgi:hypothetical protein
MTPESIEETSASSASADDASALLSRVRVIEDQPLESRAAAFVQIHDRLQATLEGSVREGTGDRVVDMSNANG